MNNLYILLLSPVFLFTACSHDSKTFSRIRIANKAIIKHAVSIDTALVCADYNNAGDYYADDGPTLKEYEHTRKGYFNGKIKLSEDYVQKHLFDGMGSVSDSTVWNKESSKKTLDEVSTSEFYLIKTVTTTSMYKGIIYEKLTDEESTKYFVTIDKKGRFISRILVGWYGPLGTYVDNEGEKHPYYTTISGCIYKDAIELQDDRDQGRITNDNSSYKIQPNGKIIRVVPVNNR